MVSETGTVHVVAPRTTGEHRPSTAAGLLGSARMLSLAIQETVESKLQTELAGDRLSRSQWKLLEIFTTTTVGNVTEVAAYLGVSTAAASKAVDRLVRLNLLERTIDTLDRRHVRLALSPEGERLARAFLDGLHVRLQGLLGESGTSDLAEIRCLLDQLTARVLNAVGNPSGICLQCGLNAREACLVDEILRRDCLFHVLQRNNGARARTSPDGA